MYGSKAVDKTLLGVSSKIGEAKRKKELEFFPSVRQPFPPTALRRRHAQTVRDSSSSYKMDYVIVVKTFLNPEGHQNRITDSKVTAILLKG